MEWTGREATPEPRDSTHTPPKPDPAEALSDLGNCGIYLFEPEIFDYFPERPFVDWAEDVFPALLEHDVPFFVHDLGDEYWNDVGSLDELRQGTFDALEGRLHLDIAGEAVADGVTAGPGTDVSGAEVVDGPVWLGRDVVVEQGTRLQGPLVIGDRATVGGGAALRESIVFPGSRLDAGTILIGAITGQTGIVEALSPRVREATRPER